MHIHRLSLMGSLSFACLLLSGCSGEGGVSSTPAPTPTPSPTATPTPTPASYTKIADMTGNRSFQTAGVNYTLQSGAFVNGTAVPFASNTSVTVTYAAATDSYTLTVPGNSVTFAPADLVQQNIPNLVQWRKTNGSRTETFNLIVPSSGAVLLSYLVVGTWLTQDQTTGLLTGRAAIGGAQTLASDMPRTGTVNYTVAVGGSATQNGLNYRMNGTSSGTFSANFATGGVTTSMTLAGVENGGANTSTVPLGTFTGNGTIASGTPGFTGTLTGASAGGTSASGNFAGAFFGPQALEVGYAYTISSPSATGFSAIGTVTGAKP